MPEYLGNVANQMSSVVLHVVPQRELSRFKIVADLALGAGGFCDVLSVQEERQGARR